MTVTALAAVLRSLGRAEDEAALAGWRVAEAEELDPPDLPAVAEAGAALERAEERLATLRLRRDALAAELDHAEAAQARAMADRPPGVRGRRADPALPVERGGEDRPRVPRRAHSPARRSSPQERLT